MLSTEQKIGAFFIVGLVLLFAAIELTLGLGLFRRHYPLYATFHDVQGLNVGADVLLAGLKVGRVDGMHIEERHVVVGMRIDGGYAVKKDSIARLEFRALSGDRFVAISLGSPTAGDAKPGDTIDGETPASFSEVVDQLSTVAENVSALTESLRDSSERLLAGLADVVEKNRDALGDTAQHLASITGKLDQGTGTLGLLLNDPALYQRVTSTMGDVQQSAHDLGAVARNLSEGRGTLGKLVSEDAGLYSQMRDTVDSLNVVAQNAEEISTNLRQGEGTLGKVITDPSLYDQAQDTLHTVNRATQSIEDQSAISLLGTIVTSLF
jgi:phospholipid/cholesterol/gamma-HCH transport system substrate-binding protein